jgi:hypothetical protein
VAGKGAAGVKKAVKQTYGKSSTWKYKKNTGGHKANVMAAVARDVCVGTLGFYLGESTKTGEVHVLVPLL